MSAPTEDQTSEVVDALRDCIAITEMSGRVDLANEEDAEMLQRAANVTMRLLEQAVAALTEERT